MLYSEFILIDTPMLPYDNEIKLINGILEKTNKLNQIATPEKLIENGISILEKISKRTEALLKHLVDSDFEELKQSYTEIKNSSNADLELLKTFDAKSDTNISLKESLSNVLVNIKILLKANHDIKPDTNTRKSTTNQSQFMKLGV